MSDHHDNDETEELELDDEFEADFEPEDAEGLSASSQAIREAVRTGKYQVDPDKLAVAMLHHQDRPLKP